MHSCEQTTRQEGWFEVIVGKSITAEGAAKCFGFVKGYGGKAKRRLFELLTAEGMQTNQPVIFLSDGSETVRDLQLYLHPQAEHLWDWFHLTMRLTAMQQTAKGLPQMIDAGDGEEPYALRDPILRTLESTKWYLGHGNVFRAFSVSGQLFPEGLLQDLLKPRRDRAAEQRSEEGDIACGVDVLGIHPQLQPESSPV